MSTYFRLSDIALGRPKKGETRDKAQDYRDECERVEVERRFSLAKRKCGMGLVTAKLRETASLCDRHVRSGAESPQDSARHFAFAYISLYPNCIDRLPAH